MSFLPFKVNFYQFIVTDILIFCSSYLLTSPRLPYPLNQVTVCDKPVGVISPIARRQPREDANNTRADHDHQRLTSAVRFAVTGPAP